MRGKTNNLRKKEKAKSRAFWDAYNSTIEAPIWVKSRRIGRSYLMGRESYRLFHEAMLESLNTDISNEDTNTTTRQVSRRRRRLTNE